MRRLLLWMARNQWLRDRLPRLPFARRAVRRFMPGETVDDALNAATAFGADGLGALFTRLGENLGRIEEADDVVAHYLALIEQIRERQLDGEISVKLTQLGFDHDPEQTFRHMVRLAEAGAAAGKSVWIDMESSTYTEPTIALYERLRVEHRNVGICLQAYLRRTALDLQRLLPLGPEIRLVKGAYAEPAEVAYPRGPQTDANFLALSISMLEAARAGRPIRIGLGTHDVRLIEQITSHAAALGLPRGATEIQMLYGIRMDEQRRLAREGYRVLDLVAYGEAWYPWYMRRLAERPANVLFALRQIVG